MTRQTREQIERIDAIGITVNRVANALNWTLIIYVGGATIAGAAVGYGMIGTDRAAIGGGGIGAALGLFVVTVATWDVLREALTTVGKKQEGDDWPFVETGERQRTRLPVVYDERGRETDRWTRLEYDEYMAAVLDDDDETGFNQRDAARFGHERDKFNALVEWVHARGWYRYANGADNRNGGDFIAPRQTILAPAPAGDNA